MAEEFSEAVITEDFSEAVIAAWENGNIVAGVDPAVRRKDECGAWIERDQYGVMEKNGSGWMIDRLPVNLCDGSKVANLHPTQWENLQSKIRWLNDKNNGRLREGEWYCVRVARLTGY
jgi:hypothetical protein